jgi:glycosyl transferase, family 25
VFQTFRRYLQGLRGVRQHPESDSTLGDVLGAPVFVINLERSPHRRAFIVPYLESLGIRPQIFPAVDGRLLDLGQLVRDGTYDDAYAHQRYSRSLSMGEIACTLSHVELCRKIVADGLSVAVVLEDDITFIDGVADVVRKALANAPADWELLQLYHWCKDTHPIADGVIGFNNKTCMPLGSLGYVIRQSAAKKLLETALPVCYPADSLMGRSPRVGVKLYGTSPSVITLEGNAIFPTEVRTPDRWPARARLALKRAFVGAATTLLGRR